MATPILTIEPLRSWQGAGALRHDASVLDALEEGAVIFLPALGFDLMPAERGLLKEAATSAKNVSYDIERDDLRGASATADGPALRSAMARYAALSRTLLQDLLPHYCNALETARTSFRPVEIAGRRTSWRKDDRRLHIDAFPSRPVRGRRILRVFTNVNPRGRLRHWRLGEPFGAVVERFLPKLSTARARMPALLASVGITKGMRSDYDAAMLGLHDAMKADLDYQSSCDKTEFLGTAGATWLAFTDMVSHAALGGQYCFEQTFHLDPKAQRRPERAPLAVLERQLGRSLVG